MSQANFRVYTELLTRREQLRTAGVSCAEPLTGRNVSLDFTYANFIGGRILAEITLGFRSQVKLVRRTLGGQPWHWVETSTADGIDTLSMQMAGTFVTPGGDWRGCASGPFRLAAFKEKLFQRLPVVQEDADTWIVVLESARAPDEEVFDFIRHQATGTPPERVIICFAPVTSTAGTVRVAARCAERAMHAWIHQNWALPSSVRVHGFAPVARLLNFDEAEMMARTNEAILEAGSAVLYVEGVDRNELVSYAPRLCFSGLFPGTSFRDLLASAGHFSQLPELALAPARITLVGEGDPIQCGTVNEEALTAAWGV